MRIVRELQTDRYNKRLHPIVPAIGPVITYLGEFDGEVAQTLAPTYEPVLNDMYWHKVIAGEERKLEALRRHV